MARIYTPVKDYNGISAGVPFRNGAGETSSPHLLKWFQKHGYRVEEVQEDTELEANKRRSRKQKE